MAVPSYPFPSVNTAFPNVEDVIYTMSLKPNDLLYKAAFDRAQGEEARLQRLRYLSIEEELERAYRYVNPSEENAKVFSLKFAEVIRAAANGYEIFCKTLYARFYNDTDELNIFNYLALDRFLELSTKKVAHLMALDDFPQFHEMSQPFAKVEPWDKASPLQPSHIPEWWTAYNRIKHSDDGLKTHATMANATAAVAALFLLIETVFGFCVLNGGPFQRPGTAPHTMVFAFAPRWARLFARR